MSVSEAMSKRPRRSFSPEFKAEVIELCRQPGRAPHSVAAELDLTETAVRRWVNQAEVDAGVRAGTTSSDAEELARLRKQLGDEAMDGHQLATAFDANLAVGGDDLDITAD